MQFVKTHCTTPGSAMFNVKFIAVIKSTKHFYNIFSHCVKAFFFEIFLRQLLYSFIRMAEIYVVVFCMSYFAFFYAF